MEEEALLLYIYHHEIAKKKKKEKKNLPCSPCRAAPEPWACILVEVPGSYWLVFLSE